MSVNLITKPENKDLWDIYANKIECDDVTNTFSGELHIGDQNSSVYICQDKQDPSSNGLQVDSQITTYSRAVFQENVYLLTRNFSSDNPVELNLDTSSRLTIGVRTVLQQQTNPTTTVVGNFPKAIIRTQSLTTPGGGVTIFNWDNNLVGSNNFVMSTVYQYLGTQGSPWLECQSVPTGAQIRVHNSSNQALNGVLEILCLVI
jgi:hypothetical protein